MATEDADKSHGDAESANSRVIARQINALADQLRDQSEQGGKQEKKRALREWVTIVALIVAGLAGIVSARLLYVQLVDARGVAKTQIDEMHKQSIALQNQLTLAYPPKLFIGGMHFWMRGKGKIFNPDNPSPKMIPGSDLDGSVNVVNVGHDVATIIDSNIQAVWRKGPFTMYNVAWGDPGHNELKFFKKASPFDVTGRADKLSPGQDGRWDFSTVIPEPGSGTSLYIIGHVAYSDPVNGSHGYYFIRRYDPDLVRFVSAPEAGDYEFSN